MSDAELGAGERLGSWVLGQKLGRGGMGSVYLATHHITGKEVAIKVVHVRLGKDGNAALLREAKILSRIEAPNVVEALDCGVRDDGTVWLAMKLLHGRSLRHLLERHREAGREIELATLIRWTYALLLGLAELHAAGVVHRDVKPENVMIEPDGRPVLVDLGIAYAKTKRTTTTEPKKIRGTPDYMAPEQVSGKAYTDRTDVYAIGCMFYEILTGGMHPYTREDEQAEGPTTVEIWSRHMHADPIPLAERGKTTYPKVERWLMSLLEKDWEKRPNAATAAVELCTLAREVGLELPPPPVGIRNYRPPNPEDAEYTTRATEESKQLPPARLAKVVVREPTPVVEKRGEKLPQKSDEKTAPVPRAPLPKTTQRLDPAAPIPSPAPPATARSGTPSAQVVPARGAVPVPRTLEMEVVQPSSSGDVTPGTFSTPRPEAGRGRASTLVALAGGLAFGTTFAVYLHSRFLAPAAAPSASAPADVPVLVLTPERAWPSATVVATASVAPREVPAKAPSALASPAAPPRPSAPRPQPRPARTFIGPLVDF